MKAAYALRRRRLQAAVILASIGLVISTLLALNQQISGLEESVLQVVYGLPGPFSNALYVVTQAGSVGAALAVILTAAVLKRRQLATRLAVNSVVTYAIVTILKAVIARPRPAEIVTDVVVRLEYANGYGFPSGHTAIVTVLALTLMPVTPKQYRWLLWLWVAAVGFSRMYLGVHAPLDIVGGFCIGVIVAGVSSLFGGAEPQKSR